MISEITLDNVKNYLRVYDDEDDSFITAVMAAATGYIVSYTNIPEDELDSYNEFDIAFYCLCADMYDVRAITVQDNKTNPTVEIILDMHRRNLIATGAAE